MSDAAIVNPGKGIFAGMALLTIAIPTYNRNAIVLQLVRSLLAQITPECQIMVFDNGCTEPIRDTLENGIECLSQHLVRVVRVEANVGQAVLRCLELCDTPWMWLLTDKAVIRPNAIQCVLDSVREHGDCMFINFTPKLQGSVSAVERAQSVETCGQIELIKNIINYGAIIDYMASVYHVPSCIGSIGVASLHMGSGAPQLAVVLHAVGGAGKCFLSSEVPMERPWTPPSMAWSPLQFLGSYMTPLVLVESKAARKLLARHILEFMPSRKYFIVVILLMAVTDYDKAEYMFRVYKQIMLANDSRVGTRFYLLIGGVFMLAPKFSVTVLDLIARTLFRRSLYELK